MGRRLLGLLVVVAACSPKNNGTLLVAHVDTDLAVGSSGALDSIEIQIVPQHGGGTTDSFPIPNRASLPVTLAIRPSGDPSFSIDVTAIGHLGATNVVSQTATVPFTPGEALEFTLYLAQDCAKAMPCTTTTNVCLKGGTCVPKTQVAQTQPYVPGGDDAGVDAGRDSGNVFDAGDHDARSNPGQWVPANPPFPTAATLNGVWPVGDNDVWVVGAMASRGIASHFIQGLWTDALLPNTAPTLYGVWASGSSDVWAVGIGGTVVHSDGLIWSAVSISGTTPTQNLSAVWGASATDVWVVGEGGLILHGSANGLMREISNTTENLTAVWGTAANEVWAVSALGTVLRREPTGWTVQATDLAARIFYGLWLAGRADVWVAGDRVSLHNDGVAWAAAPNPLDVATSIWGSASDDIWAVGRSTAPNATVISRFNGVQWLAVTSPATMPLQAVRGSSATNVWAVGNGGTVLRLQAP
jgi:hypothetical protein